MPAHLGLNAAKNFQRTGKQQILRTKCRHISIAAPADISIAALSAAMLMSAATMTGQG